MNRGLNLFLKGLLLFVIALLLFLYGNTYLTPSEKIGEIILQISLVFTGFGLLAYTLNINKDIKNDINRTLAGEFRISAIFGILSVILSFAYLGISEIQTNLPNILFYLNLFVLMLCVLGLFAPILEYNLFSKK